LGLRGEAGESFRRLCDEGCEPGQLLGLFRRLTVGRVTGARRRRRVQRLTPYRTFSGLQVTGKFDASDSPRVDIAQSVEATIVSTPIRRLRTDDLVRLTEQLLTCETDLRELLATGLARRVTQAPVLNTALPGQLRALADWLERLLPEDGCRTDSKATGSRRAYITVDPRPLDSIETALGKFEVRDLAPLQRRFGRLAARIRGLFNSQHQSTIADDLPAGLLLLPDRLDAFARTFVGRMMAETIGPKRSPERTRILMLLFAYLKDRTGRYHEAHVASILNGLGFLLSQAENGALQNDEASLRKWRSRQKPVGPPVAHSVA
jgi:hypothetical protein